MWHVDARGRSGRSAGSIPPLDLLAAGVDGRLVAAAGPHLWQSTDGGNTFTGLAAADGPVRAVAATVGGTAWATDRRLTFTAGRRGGSLALPGRTRGLRFCGDTLLVLHERGLLAIDLHATGRPRALPSAPVARRLGCGGPGDEAWWLIGPGLFVSRDRGATFVPVPGLPAVAVVDAVAGAAGTWLATSTGLFLLGSGPSPGMGVRPPVVKRARWAALLPRLVLSGTAAVAAGRTDFRAVAYADFPLGEKAPTAVLSSPALTSMAALPPAPDAEAPCLQRARAAAVALAAAEPERARSAIARAGRAAWLPELRLRVDRRLGRSESLNVPAGAVTATGPLGLDTANDVRYEARATWDLSRLVFNPDEIAAQGQALRMADVRRELESLVNRLYFERRRLTMDLDGDAPADPTSRARRTLRAEELQAELEALSGGAFQRCLAGPPP
jgi:hypothetical protein